MSPSDIGRKIFEDPRFSIDQATSCASCHKPTRSFSSSEPVAVGHNHLRATRNAPSLLNATAYRSFFWDGRAPTLEDQVLRPFVNTIELGLRSHQDVIEKIRKDQAYVGEFRAVFGVQASGITIDQVAAALAAYVRTLGQVPNQLDCFLHGQPESLSSTERAGLDVFRGPAGCASCHLIENGKASLTDNQFHVSGIGVEKLGADLPQLSQKLSTLDQRDREELIFGDPAVAAAGRFIVTLDPKDIGAFRTPSLRNVADTAPYMHDGSIASLEEAVDYELYYTGSQHGAPIVITPVQRSALLAFLRALGEPRTQQRACAAPGH